jgi:hypothetical protein
VESSCEQDNEHLGTIICWEILAWQIDWQLLEKYSAPCRYLGSSSICSFVPYHIGNEGLISSPLHVCSLYLQSRGNVYGL